MTVFVISWVNPDEKLAHKNFEDYLTEGPLAALDAIEKATGEKDVNVIGYCLGGTLLAATLGYLAAKKDKRIASATFMTALVDFTAAGELEVFIDEAAGRARSRSKMNERGYLEGSEMATTFNMLRANDLIWSFVINNYLLGRDPFPFDLLHWNCDSTRMPATMHSYYLRNMYMKNLLREPGGAHARRRADRPLEGGDADATSSRRSRTTSRRGRRRTRARSCWAARRASCCRAPGHIAGMINPPPRTSTATGPTTSCPTRPTRGSPARSSTRARGGPTGAHGSTPYLGREVPARVPGKGKLKVIEAAPGTYARIRADGR